MSKKTYEVSVRVLIDGSLKESGGRMTGYCLRQLNVPADIVGSGAYALDKSFIGLVDEETYLQVRACPILEGLLIPVRPPCVLLRPIRSMKEALELKDGESIYQLWMDRAGGGAGHAVICGYAFYTDYRAAARHVYGMENMCEMCKRIPDEESIFAVRVDELVFKELNAHVERLWYRDLELPFLVKRGYWDAFEPVGFVRPEPQPPH